MIGQYEIKKTGRRWLGLDCGNVTPCSLSWNFNSSSKFISYPGIIKCKTGTAEYGRVPVLYAERRWLLGPVSYRHHPVLGEQAFVARQ